MQSQPRKKNQKGFTLVETAVFLMLSVPLLVSLASTVGVFSKSTTSGHHRANINAENHRILQRIASELMQTCTRIDHALAGNSARPQAEVFGAGTTNTAYDYVDYEALHPMDMLHEVAERDGNDSWRLPSPLRKFYIYATYTPFDTIEYQKVNTPDDMSHVNTAAGTVVQPWSPRRKIFLMDGTVYLRALDAGGNTKSVVLGTGVASLKFHMNVDGHIIVRLTTVSGKIGNGASEGAKLTSQITINPRNGLT